MSEGRAATGTLRDLYAEHATNAVAYIDEHARVTFSEAYRTAARIAHLLVYELGVRPGDSIAIAMRNRSEWPLAFMAATAIGARVVVMDSRWEGVTMRAVLLDTASSVLFADRERIERLGDCGPMPDVKVVAVDADSSGQVFDLEGLLGMVDDVAMPPSRTSSGDPAATFFTSDTAGHPQPVTLSHRSILTWVSARDHMSRADNEVRLVAPLSEMEVCLGVLLDSFSTQTTILGGSAR